MESTKGRILCTEDDVDTRELIDFVLTRYGYEVVCSASNVQAIDLAKTQNFDLYLVDNRMLDFLVRSLPKSYASSI
jgi:CheY-like chemotaxis protein